MTDALVDHTCTVSTYGKNNNQPQVADDIDGLEESEVELPSLVKRLDEPSTRHVMEISAENNKACEKWW